MTSTYDFMKDGWLTLTPSSSDDYDALYTCLVAHGIRPKEFLIYSTLRAFLIACGLPTEQPVAFHRGTFVGTLSDVENYLSGKGLNKHHEAYAG